MRPRKKTNLAPRLEACSDIILREPQTLFGAVKSNFPNPDAPLELELGCGKGKFACDMAAKNPGVNFVAVEREANVAVIAVERGRAAELPNLRFIVGDAAELPKIFAPGEISRIYINFCDPWHKRRQYKRRLTHREWLESYKKLLTPDGEIWFKTDNYMLFHFSTFEFDSCMTRFFTTRDLHASEHNADNVRTEYEEYFANLGQPIYSIRARK